MTNLIDINVKGNKPVETLFKNLPKYQSQYLPEYMKEKMYDIATHANSILAGKLGTGKTGYHWKPHEHGKPQTEQIAKTKQDLTNWEATITKKNQNGFEIQLVNTCNHAAPVEFGSAMGGKSYIYPDGKYLVVPNVDGSKRLVKRIHGQEGYGFLSEAASEYYVRKKAEHAAIEWLRLIKGLRQ
jgi:hypothetical protein